MEAKKVTIFLFLLLVVVMAVSGFLVYDALGGFPAPPSQPMGVGYALVVGTPGTAGVGYGLVVGDGGAR